jgi:hypothetical protein
MENGSKLPAQVGMILSVAGVYALLVSPLYLYGCWGIFNLNVFEYIGLGDLLTHGGAVHRRPDQRLDRTTRRWGSIRRIWTAGG